MTKNDSSAVIDLFNHLWANAIHKDTIVHNYWYTFYNDSFDKLMSVHIGLFTALIATAIAIFAYKYWLDNRTFNDEFDNRIHHKLSVFRKDVKKLKSDSITSVRDSYIHILKILIEIDKEEKLSNQFIAVISSYFSNESPDDNDAKMLLSIYPHLFSRLNKIDAKGMDDEVREQVYHILQRIKSDAALVPFVDSDKIETLLKKFCVSTIQTKNEPKEKISALRRIWNNITALFSA